MGQKRNDSFWLQGENLHMHDLLRGLEVKCREAEETAERKTSQASSLLEMTREAEPLAK